MDAQSNNDEEGGRLWTSSHVLFDMRRYVRGNTKYIKNM